MKVPVQMRVEDFIIARQRVDEIARRYDPMLMPAEEFIIAALRELGIPVKEKAAK